MLKRVVFALLFLFVNMIYGGNLKTYYDNYINTSDGIRAMNSELIKNKYKRRVIISQSFPKLVFNTNFYKYSGVYDLNSIQAKYLNFTFDVDVNFAKNLHIELSIFQNIYSGEKIYDMKRINKKENDILLLEKNRKKFKELKNFIETYEDLLILKNDVEIMRTQYELSNIQWLKRKNHISKDSQDEMVYKKQLENLHNIYFLKKKEFRKRFDDFGERTQIKALENINISWLYDLFVFDKDSLDIKLLKENISLLYINRRLNSDNFKPTIDIFFTYGLQDDDMETLDDGYKAGILINWNIFDGFKDKYMNKKIDVDIEEQKSNLQKLVNESRKNFHYLNNQIEIFKEFYKNEKEIINILKEKLDKKEMDFKNGLISKEKFLKSKKKYLEEKRKFFKYSREYIFAIYDLSLLSDNFSGFWKVVK